MPKLQYKILDWSGGIVNAATSTDLLDNESSGLENVSISTNGSLKMGRDFSDNHPLMDTTETNTLLNFLTGNDGGAGIFPFKHDFKKLTMDGVAGCSIVSMTGTTTANKYWAHTYYGQDEEGKIYDVVQGASGLSMVSHTDGSGVCDRAFVLNPGNGYTVGDNFLLYFADGVYATMVVDETFLPGEWYGQETGVNDMGGNSYLAGFHKADSQYIDIWDINNATFSGIQSQGGSHIAPIVWRHVYNNGSASWGITNPSEVGAKNHPTFTSIDGALRFCDGGHSASSRNINKTLMYVKRRRFKSRTSGAVSTMNHTFSSWVVNNGLHYYKPSSTFLHKQTNGLPPPELLNVQASSTDPSVPGSIIIDPVYTATGVNGTGKWKEHNWDLAISYVYDGNQETTLKVADSRFATWALSDNGSVTNSMTIGFKLTLKAFELPSGYWGQAFAPHFAHSEHFDPRITHIKIYMKTYSGDIWYLQGICEMYKGIDTLQGHEPEGWSNGPQQGVTSSVIVQEAVSPINGDGSYTLQEPRFIETYESETGRSADEVPMELKYSTAVLANRRLYAGNISYIDKDGTKQRKSDGIIKSNVNQFDSFSQNNIIEASINDGSSIIHLEEYADRLLQFKEDKLEIINIAQQMEFLESTHPHKGVSWPSAVCKTEYGIAWANRSGMWFYDGQIVRNLHESKNRPKILVDPNPGWGQSAGFKWSTFIETGNKPVVGFCPLKKELWIFGQSDGQGLSYDKNGACYHMPTESWAFHTDIMPTNEVKTNFILQDIDSTPRLCIGVGDNTVKMLTVKSAGQGSNILWRSKNFDFGYPAQRKKIYKIYVTYACGVSGGNPNAEMRYFSDDPIFANGGEGDHVGQFLDGENYSQIGGFEYANVVWMKAELVPSVAINNTKHFGLSLKRVSGTVSENFEINDITIIYRLKNVN